MIKSLVSIGFISIFLLLRQCTLNQILHPCGHIIISFRSGTKEKRYLTSCIFLFHEFPQTTIFLSAYFKPKRKESTGHPAKQKNRCPIPILCKISKPKQRKIRRHRFRHTIQKRVVKTAFPKAEIVADRFHALRLAIYALEQIRKEVQKNFHTKRRKYFKHARTLLIKHKEKLEPEELEQVSNMLTPSKELALKKLAYDRFASPDIYTAKKRLLAFKMAVQAANLACSTKLPIPTQN